MQSDTTAIFLARSPGMSRYPRTGGLTATIGRIELA